MSNKDTLLVRVLEIESLKTLKMLRTNGTL